MRFLDSLGRKDNSRKVLVIGLDCAAPELVFDRWRDDLPNLTYLAESGAYGDLQSCIPAITVPAWSVMMSGKDPGELGIYGFRNRSNHTYDGRFIATGDYVKEKRVWDYLTEQGKQSVVVGVPQTFPVKPINGKLISGFLTPGTHSEFTYPTTLKDEVLAISPEYDVDVRQFRTDDKDYLLEQIWNMTEKRFAVVDELLVNDPWDFFMLMEIGVDRIHHGFWSYHDPLHRRYSPGNPYENAIHDYYVYIDRKIGEWLNRIPKDTVVIVVSDHGAKRMDGGICLNEWLWQEGYLAFKEDPKPGTITRFDDLEVDWERTTAWGDGGYYGRVFINVRGREPKGQVLLSDYDAFRSQLAEKLTKIPNTDGNSIGTRVFEPHEIYREVRGVPPDLMVYFGDLLWRSVGTLGHGSTHTLENDTGPDDCNHAQNGLMISYDPRGTEASASIQRANLQDVASAVMGVFAEESSSQPFPNQISEEALAGD